ncbi:MAG: GLPGLI family protein [Bacteroidetes bacterium]|nr:GLPGLI family protein [Bacteroidota bacterium]
MNFKQLILMMVCIWGMQHIASSQITFGKITYERKTNLYKKFKYNGDVKEWLKEEDKNKIDMFELYFNDSLAVFKPQESDLAERMSWATSKNVVYQNFHSNYRLTEKKIWGELFLVADSVRHFKWKVTDSKRSICGYQCRKAIWQANDSTRIYAWFCSEVNASVGPESFVGLPGAILGLATEDGGVIYFAKSVEMIKPEITTLVPKKSKQKTYKSAELKAQLEKDFGKEKWGKAMIYNNFSIW